MINVEYNDDIITCSMTIKYDKNKFSIKSKDDLNSSKKNSEQSGIPYQTLINLYLTDCAENNRELKIAWQ